MLSTLKARRDVPCIWHSLMCIWVGGLRVAGKFGQRWLPQGRTWCWWIRLVGPTFFNLGTTDIWSQIIPFGETGGAVLCTVQPLAVALTSTHQMSHHLPCVMTTAVSPNTVKCPQKGKITPSWEPLNNGNSLGVWGTEKEGQERERGGGKSNICQRKEWQLQRPQREKAVWLEGLADRTRPWRLRRKEMSGVVCSLVKKTENCRGRVGSQWQDLMTLITGIQILRNKPP